MGPVMKGLRLAELAELDSSVMAVAMESMAGDETVPPSKKRVMLRKVRFCDLKTSSEIYEVNIRPRRKELRKIKGGGR